MTLALLVLASLVAAVVASTTGFGAAIVLTPFAAMVIDLKQAIVLVAYFVLFVNLFNMLRLRGFISYRTVILFGLPSVLTTLVGAMLFDRLNVDIISVVFGVVILLFVGYSFTNTRYKIPAGGGPLVLGGALSGITAGLVGMGGPFRSMFLVSTVLGKNNYIATSATLAVLVSATRIGVYLFNDSLNGEYYIYILPLVVIAFVGTYAGLKLLSRLSSLVVKRSVLVLLALIAVKLLFFN
jgi:uncharacterized membrane protein YfcA